MSVDNKLTTSPGETIVSDSSSVLEASGDIKTKNIVSYWPLLMVAVGGLLGLMLGGIAAAVNTQIMKSSLPKMVKYPLVLSTGLIAMAVWFVLVILLQEATGS